MSLSNKKILLAPILALALALSIAGATSYFPTAQQVAPHTSPAIPSGTPFPPEPQPVTVESNILIPILSGVASIAVAITVVFVLFSEKELNRDNKANKKLS
jgi:flagellar basal body-associated protein FliL